MENYENVIYTVICGYGVPVGTIKILFQVPIISLCKFSNFHVQFQIGNILDFDCEHTGHKEYVDQNGQLRIKLMYKK